MNENALNDLTHKIRNVVRDFEHEQAANGTTVNVTVSPQGDYIYVGIGEMPYNDKSPFDDVMPMASKPPVIGPGDSVQVGWRDEEDADFNKTMREMYEMGEVNGSIYPSDLVTGAVETGRVTTADEPDMPDAGQIAQSVAARRKKTEEMLRSLPNSTMPKSIDPNTSTI